MGVQKHKFFEGNALGLLILGVMFGFFASAIPDWSLKLFIIFMIINIICLIIARYWYNKVEKVIRYNSLVCFLMFSTTGFFFVVPLLRIFYGTLIFWPILLIYLLVLTYSLLKRELIFQAFHKPGQSKIYYGTYVFLFLLFVLGSFAFIQGKNLGTSHEIDYQGAIFALSIVYCLGLLISFCSFAFLKRPEDIKNY